MSARGRHRIALALALLGAAAAPAWGQTCNINGPKSCTVSNNITSQVGAATELELPGPGIALATPDVSDYDALFQNTVGPTAIVRANSSWALAISASTTNGYWTAGGGAWANKPAGDLKWSLAPGGPYTSLVVAPASAPVTSGSGPTAGTNIPLYFQTALDWANDKPGDYTLTVLYTLTAP